ncbi:MAG: fumarylacetoacetate hydrolase family protein [Burkholderiales bacterium]|nr:fumarylacetoacetate hydrolase family protein [Burkholderiales bacterium]
MTNALARTLALGGPRGTVYGALLNYRDALAAMADALHHPPYKAPPKAPVLYIKPRNTIVASGDDIVVPAGTAELAMGAALGVVIGRAACRVTEADALSYLAGYTAVNDVCIPHDSYYRPALRCIARDTFCAIGACVPADAIPDPDAVALTVAIDGSTVQRASTAGLVRPVRRLLAEVTEFMTLAAGDVLLVGVPHGSPRARAGQRVRVTIDGVGSVENPLVAEAAGA